GEFNGELQVVKPGKPGRLKFGEEGGRERGTDEAIIIDWRPARAQHVRLALEQAGSAEWATKRRYRFQCEMLPSDPIITKGMLVRFRGGNDATLASFTFQVISASNSSHAALRTIE